MQIIKKIFDRKERELEEILKDNRYCIYCSRCQMWFDTINGWYADEYNPFGFDLGVPICPACGAPLRQIEAHKFYERNREQSRMQEVSTWEWPNGSLWNKNKKAKKARKANANT